MSTDAAESTAQTAPTRPSPDESSLADRRWHRVHPLTPVLRSGAVLVALVSIGISRIEDAARSSLSDLAEGRHPAGGQHHTGSWLVAGAILTGVLTFLLVINWLSWRKNEFLVDDTSIHVRKGIVGRQQRKARLDRVQAIDLNQPLLPRLFGLAQLKFDVAGGSNSHIAIEYLRRGEAEALRTAMLDRVRVSRETSAPEGIDAFDGSPSAADAIDADGDSGVTTPAPRTQERSRGGELTTDAGSTGANGATPTSHPGDGRQTGITSDTATAAAHREGASLGSRIVHGLVPGVFDDLSGTLSEALAPYRVQVRADATGSIVRVPPHRVIAAQLMTTGALVGTSVAAGIVVMLAVGVATGHAGDALSIAVTLSFMVFGFVHAAFRMVLRDANFSVALTPDGIVVTHGLTTTTRRVVPVDRIQAVVLDQPWLWRRFGWWRVRMNLASGAALGEDSSSVLLPVGSRDEAMTLMGLVLPDPGTPSGVSGRDLMLEAMTAGRTTDASTAASLFIGPGRRAGVLDPITARREAWARTRTMSVIRNGRLTRRVVCVPHARVQSLAMTQGPLQRRLGLATLELHSTSGPATPTVEHLDAGLAERLVFDHADVTRRARAELDGR